MPIPQSFDTILKKEWDRWVGARHLQSFNIYNYIIGAVPFQLSVSLLHQELR